MATTQSWLILWSVIGTGISSITVQVVTIREFLSQFQGNEITISLTLFCWLLLTGLGSLTGEHRLVPDAPDAKDARQRPVGE